ncbi:MAG: hydroxymethylbilane synthase [Armatimonadetes bacterium]|nr:hydroxymethylbilane synthase [Armatimonadota bacterium]
MSANAPHLRIGTRGSALALAQSGWIAGELSRLHPGLTVEFVTITTKGDRILDRALSQVGGKGLFVTEIENALLAGEIDLAVHSLKDVPTEQPPGLILAAFPPREDPRDVLVSRNDRRLADLPPGAVIATSSLRRTAQLRHARPDLQFTPIRGNVDTRIRKMRLGQADAVVLAAAGLIRLGRTEWIAEHLDPDVCLPAAGQGILCLEARADDGATRELLAGLDCRDSRICAEAERHVIAALGGSCQVPMGVLAEANDGTLRIRAMVSDLQGDKLLRTSGDTPEAVVAQLREMGADELLGRN